MRRALPSLLASSLLAVVTALTALTIGGCYETPTPECAFHCGEGSACPDGYTCSSSDNWCKRDDLSPEFVCDQLAPDAASNIDGAGGDIDAPTFDADLNAPDGAPDALSPPDAPETPDAPPPPIDAPEPPDAALSFDAPHPPPDAPPPPPDAAITFDAPPPPPDAALPPDAPPPPPDAAPAADAAAIDAA